MVASVGGASLAVQAHRRHLIAFVICNMDKVLSLAATVASTTTVVQCFCSSALHELI
jgi:hypothetical protein